MVLDAVLKTAKELMRQAEAGTLSGDALEVQILKLERATALSSPTAAADVLEVRDLLEARIEEGHIVEAVTARVMDAIAGKEEDEGAGARVIGEVVDEEDEGGGKGKSMKSALDALLELAMESEKELIEQLAACIVAGDNVVIAAAPPGNVMEKAIYEAMSLFMSTYCADSSDISKDVQIEVTVVQSSADDEGAAKAMAKRLQGFGGIKTNVADDWEVTRIMSRCRKVLLRGITLDVDDGVACEPGTALLVAAANRLRVPVVVAVPRLRMLPAGTRRVAALAARTRYPGNIWEYEMARDDRSRDPVGVVAPAYDIISLHRFDAVVAEMGAYAPEYVVKIIPAYEDANNHHHADPNDE